MWVSFVQALPRKQMEHLYQEKEPRTQAEGSECSELGDRKEEKNQEWRQRSRKEVE